MKDVKLFLALTTTHGSMQTQFLPGIMDLFKWRKYPMHVNQYIDPYIILARNAAATDFLDTDATHLMFMDADIIATSVHVEKLIDHDVDIVGGLYCKKAQGKIRWVCNALMERPPVQPNGLLSLKHIGTGFMLVKRAVLEAMIKKWHKEMNYLEDEIDKQRWDFFPMRIVNRRYISEDWFFCDRARALGYKVYADTHCIVRHIGSAIYPLDTQVAESRRERDFGLAMTQNAASRDQ